MRMTMIEMHRRALDDTTALIDKIGPADLGRDTPCAGWDLAALLAHMIGQNHGFADGIEAGPDGIAAAAFEPRPVGPDPAHDWRASAERLAAALAGAPADVTVALPEIAPGQWFPLPVVTAMQLVDTLVHAWDVARALGLDYRPDDDLVQANLDVALQVPDGPERLTPSAAFAPGVTPPDPADGWTRALALFGRAPGWPGA